MANIGRQIAEARKQAGLTQDELAARVGYQTKSAINKIELGLRDLPQKKIVLFAQALGVSPGYIMGWDKEPEDLGAMAAAVLKDAEALKMLQGYNALSEEDKAVVRALVSSLSKKG